MGVTFSKPWIVFGWFLSEVLSPTHLGETSPRRWGIQDQDIRKPICLHVGIMIRMMGGGKFNPKALVFRRTIEAPGLKTTWLNTSIDITHVGLPFYPSFMFIQLSKWFDILGWWHIYHVIPFGHHNPVSGTNVFGTYIRVFKSCGLTRTNKLQLEEHALKKQMDTHKISICSKIMLLHSIYFIFDATGGAAFKQTTSGERLWRIILSKSTRDNCHCCPFSKELIATYSRAVLAHHTEIIWHMRSDTSIGQLFWDWGK